MPECRCRPVICQLAAQPGDDSRQIQGVAHSVDLVDRFDIEVLQKR